MAAVTKANRHVRAAVGRATPFDLVNAAERIYLALTNADHYGARSNVALH